MHFARRAAAALTAIVLTAAGPPSSIASDPPKLPILTAGELSANDMLDKPFARIKVGKWLTAEPDRKGKITILAFWRSDSAACGHDLIATLSGHQSQWRDDLAVVALNSEPADVQRAFFDKENHPRYGVATDPDNAMLSTLNPKSLPYVLILDSGGVVRWQCDADFLIKAARGDPAAPLPLVIRQILAADTGVAARHAVDADRRAAAATKQLEAKNLVGKPFPPLKVGQWLSAEPDRKGKVMLIEFWGTQCGPCIRSMPELNELQAKFKDDLVVIGLNAEPAEKQRRFMGEHDMAYAVATDTDGIFMALEIRAIPNVFIVGSDGIVRWQGVPTDPDQPLTADLVKRIVATDPGVAARHDPPAEQQRQQP